MSRRGGPYTPTEVGGEAAFPPHRRGKNNSLLASFFFIDYETMRLFD